MRPPRSVALLGLARLGLVVIPVMAAMMMTACGGWVGHGNTYYQRWERGPVKHQATYRFGMPGDAWAPLKQKGTQVAWYNAGLDAAILLEAQCESHGDSTLEQFTDHLRIDFRTWEVKSQEPVMLADRDAIHTVVLASIDGGPQTMLDLYVTKKNGCLFDLEYIAPPASFERGRADFARVVAGFEFPIKG